jgi:N6-adenosine-specific RNA methylase IME4
MSLIVQPQSPCRNESGKYSIITVDPPWSYSVYGKSEAAKKSRAAESKYPTMTLEEIKDIQFGHLAADNCAVFLWITAPWIVKGEEVLNAWGFRYVTVAFTWTKMVKDMSHPSMGMGYYTRSENEFCLLGLKGRLPRNSKSVRQTIQEISENEIVCTNPVIEERLREHSRKPDEAYRRIETLFDGPYLDIFGRQRRDCWDIFGNQVDLFKPALVGVV